MKPGGKHLTILGCTGSIGVKALDIARRFPDRFQVQALAAGQNIDLLAAQIAEFTPRLAVVMNEELAAHLKRNLNPDLDVRIVFGREGYIEAASLPGVDTVISAMVGGAGLVPTWAAVAAGKRVALANKETLVMAGELIMSEALRRKAEIIPVDSEHSAIFQAMEGQNRDEIKRIILTASGGPFFGKALEDMANVSRTEALSHPQWKMGAKISIDSATLMNKGLEVIEARWLFDCPIDKITIRIHPQSIIHSMVEYRDGSIIAQLGVPHMITPIAYALSYPRHLGTPLPPLDFEAIGSLTFEPPDLERFPCLGLALRAANEGAGMPAVLNAANEIAVNAFLEGNLPFLSIPRLVERVMDEHTPCESVSLEEVLKTDAWARRTALDLLDSGMV